MLTVTWTYERPTHEFPMYIDTLEGKAFQEIINTTMQDSGLKISRETSLTEDGLTLVSVYSYDSITTCRDFAHAINLRIPTFFPSRNDYMVKCGHRLTGISGEPVFLSSDGTQLEMIRVMPNTGKN
jgi:hypothetical protein